MAAGGGAGDGSSRTEGGAVPSASDLFNFMDLFLLSPAAEQAIGCYAQVIAHVVIGAW